MHTGMQGWSILALNDQMLTCNHRSAVLQGSISSTAGAASSAAEAASANLPEPVRDVLSAAKGPISQAFSQVHSPWGTQLIQLPRRVS